MAWTRFVLERVVLIPSARVLPRPVAYQVATTLGLLDVATGLGRLARHQLAASHGLTGRTLWMATWRRCSLPYIDLLHLVRSVNGGADDPNRTGIHVAVPQSLEDHLRSGRAVIVVVGHFPVCTSLAAATRVLKLRAKTGPNDSAPAIAIASSRPHTRLSAVARRAQLRTKAVRACAESLLEGTSGLVWEDGHRSLSTGTQLVRAVREPGFLCLITLDRPWNAARSARQPFAGWAEFAIGTNAARLADIGNAGITLALPSPKGKREFDVALSEVYLPEEFSGPAELTNFLAKKLERHIGLHPSEYLLSTGTDRRWNHADQIWNRVDTTQDQEAGRHAGPIHPPFDAPRGAD